MLRFAATALVMAMAAACVGQGSAPTTTTMVQVTPSPVDAGIRAKVSRTRNDMRSMATALEAYFIDFNTYPLSGTSAETTFRKQGRADRASFALVPQLSTPIAYMTSYFQDPFAEKPEDTFGYYMVSEKKGNESVDGWILYSPGPDGRNDAIWKLYDIKKPQPSPELLMLSYDPTNGTVSAGDLFRVKQ